MCLAQKTANIPVSKTNNRRKSWNFNICISIVPNILKKRPRKEIIVLNFTRITFLFNLISSYIKNRVEAYIFLGKHIKLVLNEILNMFNIIQGLKVIAFVGSDDKLAWCKNELGFDHVFNYKTSNFSDEISKVAPQGAELFFDNVIWAFCMLAYLCFNDLLLWNENIF